MDIEFTKEQKETLEQLEKYAAQEVTRETARLMEMVDIVNQAVDIRIENGNVISSLKMGSSEMEALAMKIPAECLYLQTRLNHYNTRNTFRDLRLDAQTTVSLVKMVGTKGTADERKRTAEFAVLDERIQNAVNKLIIKGIQGCIDRADKVYEGIKKVMDYRSKEGWFDRKGV